MTTAVFLRGINIGSNKRISMPALREALEKAGHTGVKTLLQSGNVVVDRITAAAMEKLISDEFGLRVRAMTRTHDQLRKVIESNPFPQHVGEPAKLAVGFLDKVVAKIDIDPSRYVPDEFVLAGKEIYLWYPNGLGRSKLGDAVFAKALGEVALTVRNWNTVTKMAELTA